MGLSLAFRWIRQEIATVAEAEGRRPLIRRCKDAVRWSPHLLSPICLNHNSHRGIYVGLSASCTCRMSSVEHIHAEHIIEQKRVHRTRFGCASILATIRRWTVRYCGYKGKHRRQFRLDSGCK